MAEIVGNGEKYFWGSKEHGAESSGNRGTRELGKSEFRGTGSFIFEQQGNMHQPQ